MACKGIIAPEKLPPSERPAYYHGLRCHYQIIEWSLLEDFEITATDWGWKLTNDVLVPVMNDAKIAPESLTKIIRCRCKVINLQIPSQILKLIKSTHFYRGYTIISIFI